MPYGETLDKLNPLPPELLAAALARHCPGEGRLLDIGCGRGAALSWLRQHTSWQAQGIEADGEYAALCGAAQGRAEELPFPDGSFDAALMQCVFSLLDEPGQAAGEIARVLRPGGVLLLTDLYGRQAGAEIADNALLRHIYRADDIADIIAGAGLALTEFIDHSPELTAWLGQMILDGTACDRLDGQCRAVLRQTRAGYGMWVFRKEAADAGL